MKKERFKKTLLVEGLDDLHVVLALAEQFSLIENFNIEDCKGIDKLIEGIPVRIKSDMETIGILIDADTNIETRWQSLKKILTDADYTPCELFHAGLIIKKDNKPTIGIWIMPNNKLEGMLEDFMEYLVPLDDSLLPFAKLMLSDIKEKGLNRYADVHQSKALIHTWLAWQENPGTPLGLSITKKYFSTDTELCTCFIDWLSRLFKDDSNDG